MLKRTSPRRADRRSELAPAPADGTTRDVIVHASAVWKTYDTGQIKVDALKGVDLSLERSEMVAVMGPSGCGKTTLLNCLSGLDDITGGDVLIDGVSLSGLSDRERTRYRAREDGFRLPVLQPDAGALGRRERRAGPAHLRSGGA